MTINQLIFEVVKDPQADKPYAFDWTERIQGYGSITTSTWTGDDGLTVHDTSISGASTIAWIRGGTARQAPYKVVNHIETNSTPPFKDDCTLYISVINT